MKNKVIVMPADAYEMLNGLVTDAIQQTEEFIRNANEEGTPNKDEPNKEDLETLADLKRINEYLEQATEEDNK